jgi:hypothetical protein
MESSDYYRNFPGDEPKQKAKKKTRVADLTEQP